MRLRILCGLALAPSAKDSQQSAVSSQAALQPRRVLDSTKTTSRTVKLVCIQSHEFLPFHAGASFFSTSFQVAPIHR